VVGIVPGGIQISDREERTTIEDREENRLVSKLNVALDKCHYTTHHLPDWTSTEWNAFYKSHDFVQVSRSGKTITFVPWIHDPQKHSHGYVSLKDVKISVSGNASSEETLGRLKQAASLAKHETGHAA